MTDIMIEMTSRPSKRYLVNRCHYCDHDKYPEGKIIDPTTDHDARKTDKGDWICGTCVIEGLYKMNEKS
jgi:hypothetical protein